MLLPKQEAHMLYTIRFHDNPDADPDLRPRYMAQHLEFLAHNKAAIHAAGPLKEEDGQVKGGLWIVETETTDQAWGLVKSDPFWPTGLRDKVEIKEWMQVFANGNALI
jgi:uncharacterized protein YciI